MTPGMTDFVWGREDRNVSRRGMKWMDEWIVCPILLTSIFARYATDDDNRTVGSGFPLGVLVVVVFLAHRFDHRFGGILQGEERCYAVAFPAYPEIPGTCVVDVRWANSSG